MRWARPSDGLQVSLVIVSLIVIYLPTLGFAAGANTVLASVEASLERCRFAVAQHRVELTSCSESRQPSKCVCICPTCLPQEWSYRKEPPLCTTPAPPPLPRSMLQPTTPAPPPTAPPPPPLPPLKVLPPYTEDNLPTIGPFPATALPTTTTIVPPEGKCIDDGFYRGSGAYEKVGDGLCVDKDDVMISFKKRRELNSNNFECVCKEACDQAPGCIGYSTNDDDGDGTASCRVYGFDFPNLGDRWVDLGSATSPRYRGLAIRAADGSKGMTCYRKTCAGGAGCVQAPNPKAEVTFVQRQTSTAELLAWQREQLSRCRSHESSMVSLLEERGCRSGLRRRGFMSQPLIPTSCECHCPECNHWQLPPPACREPTPTVTSTAEPLPDGIIVYTQPPRPPTAPPMPVQLPLPELPPLGEQFLPTLGPYPS